MKKCIFTNFFAILIAEKDFVTKQTLLKRNVSQSVCQSVRMVCAFPHFLGPSYDLQHGLGSPCLLE